jgi:hypothetical protein
MGRDQQLKPPKNQATRSRSIRIYPPQKIDDVIACLKLGTGTTDLEAHHFPPGDAAAVWPSRGGGVVMIIPEGGEPY